MGFIGLKTEPLKIRIEWPLIEASMSTILVVDDETAIRSLCYDLFTRENHKVITASRGDQVLSLVTFEKPDILLLDINIPGENGLSLLKKIRTQFPKLPVVIFSGVVDLEVEKEAFEAGAVEVLAKGAGAVELKEKIKRILEPKHKLFNEVQNPTRKEKILLVDDESSIRNFLAEFFKRKGFQTIEARNGEEAIEMVKKEKPTVVLLDIMMPGMDGLLTLKKIREFDTEVGVVMATSVQDETIAKEAANLGSYHYVLKPFDLQYLELVVLTRLTMAS